jgi:excisionase family DNA binding protein
MDRDAVPDYAERVGRMRDLLQAPALPWAEVALLLDIPVSTIDKLRAQGRGPRTVKIGRRIYVRRSDLDAWLAALPEAESEAV